MAFYQVLECPCVCHSSLVNQTDYSCGKFPATCSFWLMPPPLRPGKYAPHSHTAIRLVSRSLVLSTLDSPRRASGVRRTPAARAPGDSELGGKRACPSCRSDVVSMRRKRSGFKRLSAREIGILKWNANKVHNSIRDVKTLQS